MSLTCSMSSSILHSIGDVNMDVQEKVRENRLRRVLDRRGLGLRKSRRRDPEALDYGNYWIIDPILNCLVDGGEWGMSLDDVEAWTR